MAAQFAAHVIFSLFYDKIPHKTARASNLAGEIIRWLIDFLMGNRPVRLNCTLKKLSLP
jgi:hypothetical protein